MAKKTTAPGRSTPLPAGLSRAARALAPATSTGTRRISAPDPSAVDTTINRARRAMAPATPAATRPTATPIPPERPARVRVQATKLGFYNNERRRVGDIFNVGEKDFNRSWMQPVDPRTPLQRTTGQQELRRKHDELLLEKNMSGQLAGRDDVPDDVPQGTRNPLDD